MTIVRKDVPRKCRVKIKIGSEKTVRRIIVLNKAPVSCFEYCFL
jgi:hypothetical protein